MVVVLYTCRLIFLRQLHGSVRRSANNVATDAPGMPPPSAPVLYLLPAARWCTRLRLVLHGAPEQAYWLCGPHSCEHAAEALCAVSIDTEGPCQWVATSVRADTVIPSKCQQQCDLSFTNSCDLQQYKTWFTQFMLY